MNWFEKRERRVKEKHGDDISLATPKAEAEIRVKNSTRDLIVTINTDDVDVENEVVLPGGANFDYLQQNRSVFIDHNYDAPNFVGKMRRGSPTPMRRDGKIVGWQAATAIADNLQGRDILRMAAQGIMPGASVGFKATDYGPPNDSELKMYPKCKNIVKRWECFEYSLTFMPCNPATQPIGMSSEDEKFAVLDDLVTKSVISQETAIKLGLPRRPPVVARFSNAVRFG